jgi:PAS domain S-box-containing protein
VRRDAGILVVDDQPESLQALEALFEPLGRRVVTARSGEEALRRLLDDDFGVIVMDVRMPGLDGFETVELIKRRRRHQDTAVVFLTAGDADADQISRGYSAGAVDYIVKPVDTEVLRSKVEMLLALAEKNAELRESEQRFRAAFEDAPIGVGLSTLDGNWIEVNTALCDMVGLSHLQLLQQPLWELWHPDDREREREALARLLGDGSRSHRAEVRFTRHDDTLGHAIVNVSAPSDGLDRPGHLIWQVLDVTEERRSTTERAARAEAEAVADTLGRLQQVTETALEHLELRELAARLVEGLRDVFDADVARILLFEEHGEEAALRVAAAAGLDGTRAGDEAPLTDILERVIDGGLPVTVADLPGGAGLDPDVLLAGVETVMAAPLRVSGRAAGVIELGHASPRRFDGADERLLALMADRAGLAVEHARAYERELSTVEALQRSLLPDSLPRRERLQIAARYMPGGADVGGDWYDALELEGGRLGVAMGDVVGHGLAAASFMGQLRHAARAYALEGHSPALVLDRLDSLVRSLDGGQMATLAYVVVEPDLASARIASAGHVPPLLIGPDGHASYVDVTPDPPLGVFESAAHGEFELAIEPGSTLVLYTDGLVEERGVSIDLGLDALREAAERPGDPEELCDRLVEAMLALHPANDDIAVLALRALPAAPAPLHLELRSDPKLLASMRHELCSWLRAAGAGSEDLDVVQLAAGEACANAIEHGSSGGGGTFSLDAWLEGPQLSLEIADAGSWIERPDGPLPDRGHGLQLMRALMDDVDVEREQDGTRVRLARTLACHDGSPCSSTRSNGSVIPASASALDEPSST